MKEKGRKAIATNRKARHNYSILDVVEAGVALVGTERIPQLAPTAFAWS